MPGLRGEMVRLMSKHAPTSNSFKQKSKLLYFYKNFEKWNLNYGPFAST